jgi:hypothetical protein
MRIRQALTTLAVAGTVGGLALTPAAPATAAGTGGTWKPGPQGPCSPGGIWHPDPGWPGTSGWCEYPKKKKCWWTCPRAASATPTHAQPVETAPAQPVTLRAVA